jgi:RNA polymerase sigma-70 factor (ECF subfamily)
VASYSELSDLELVTLLKEDDKAAFTEIYRRHWHLLYLHTRKLLADKDEAKDLVQEVFFTFWTKAKELDVRTNVKGYLYMTARNKVLNAIRSKKGNTFIELIAEEITAMDHTTVLEIDERELAALIQAEIDQLPPKMKLVFELSRKEFLTHKEIAERLDMNEEAVKKQISRSIKTLRLKLGHYAGFSMLLLSFLR